MYNRIKQKRSKTNTGLLDFFEKIIRYHPLIYYMARYFIRFTNIFEEDAKGVAFLKFNKSINIIDVGASDGIAANFFNTIINVNKMICFEPNAYYVKILRKLNIKNIIVKPFAVNNTNTYKKIFYPRYKFFSKEFDLIPYTYYDKKKLINQLKLDFKFRKNIKIIEKKLRLKKIDKLNTKIDLIKIDVNDNGLAVVKGLLKIIKKDKPALLIETDSELNYINKILKKYGFKKYFFSNKRNKFYEVKKNLPLNTYFLQKKHLSN